jgi:outer membrane lipopolysaccharide assembly protein LptE/RlpB
MERRLMKYRCVALTVLVLMLLGLTNCGYRLSGYGNQVPSYIKTIFIPDFDNKTTRFQAEQFVTYAVRDEFIKRSNLALVGNREKADSLLEGEISRFDVKPISSTRESTANLYKVRILLTVKFIDLKTNNIIYRDESLLYVDTYEIDTGDFFSQETETLKKIAAKFASSVVTTILENF